MKQRKQLKQYKKALKKILKRYNLSNLDITFVEDKACIEDLLILYRCIQQKKIKKIKCFLENYSFYSVVEDLVSYYLNGDFIANNYSFYDDDLRKKDPLDLNAFVKKYIK